jgi:integrase
MDGITVREAVAHHDGWLAMRRSDGTRRKYNALLSPFVDLFGDREISTITAAEIELQHLSRYADKSPATQRNHHAALKSLFSCGERFDWIGANPMRKLEPPTKVDDFKGYMSDEHDTAVLEACITPQERVLVWTLRFTGLRISEALNLSWDDVDLSGGRLLRESPALIVLRSKSQAGRRVVAIPPMLLPILKAWRQDRPHTTLVFETANGTRMSPQFAHRLVVRVGARAGVKISPHSLRRQYGSAALNNGARIEAVSAALGHANVAVTQKSYAQLSKERLAAEMLEAMSA